MKGIVIAAGVLALAGVVIAQVRSGSARRSTSPARFKLPAMWEYTAPLITPEKRTEEPSRAQKDPTLVFHDGRWHVFMTVKLPGRTAIEYCSFE